jgi:DNA repair protein RadC
MSDVASASVEVIAVKSVRRGRSRVRVAQEVGADLLRVSARISEEEARVLAQARGILLKLSSQVRPMQLSGPSVVREYLTTLLSCQEREYFAVLALDNRNRVLASEILFAGTIDGARVYPREVVKFALRHNAAAVVLAHVHPSGVLEPSQADELITQHLIKALSLIEVRVLDHFIIGNGQSYSFAEGGRL